MKKIIILFFSALLILSVSNQNLYAQYETMSMSFNAGVHTDDSFSFDPFFWTAGLVLDINMGDYLMLSPECFVIVNKFEFGFTNLAPAVLLNFRFESLFLGGGITKWWNVDDFSEPSDFMLKLNAGFKGRNLKLTAYLITGFEDFLENNLVGATLGFYF
ncbi:MAG: hypothetical protein JSV96_16055 [Candidatus Aminicenantes bacterium]|nr:MAG: hypothetical protein JSV96_16055 [Candidatus Aminicenantes bacterium]